MKNYIYPNTLVNDIKDEWEKRPLNREENGFPQRPTLPPDESLSKLLGIVYHASLLTEEGRQLSFRIITLPSWDESVPRHQRNSTRLCKFSETRPLSVQELRRLAPVADPTRSFICVEQDSNQDWCIWALLDIGETLWRLHRNESPFGIVPPANLVISTDGPGAISISTGGSVLVALKGGFIHKKKESILSSGPIAKYLDIIDGHFIDDLNGMHISSYSSVRSSTNIHYCKFALTILLNFIRDISHGGTLIMVGPRDVGKLDAALKIKYKCEYNCVWGFMLDYFDLKTCGDENKRKLLERNVSDKLYDSLRFISLLSSVDGALLIDDRFNVLGFGVEIVEQGPGLSEVKRANDQEATITETVNIETHGTRHRSSFRFCYANPDSMAFIYSSDGGIKATMRVNNDVIFWEDIDDMIW